MPAPDHITEQFIDAVAAQLEADRPVRRALPGGGRLSIERRLPFLVVYRKRPSGADSGTDRLVVGTASYLIASGDSARFSELTALVSRIAEVMVAAFGSFLIVEVWSGDAGREDGPLPAYRAHYRKGRSLDPLTEEVSGALRGSRILGVEPTFSADSSARVAPPGMRQLVGNRAVATAHVELLGVEVKPVYRSADNGDTYPSVLRQMRRRVTGTIDRVAYRFTEVYTKARPAAHQALRARPFTRATVAIDAELAAIKESYDLLLQVTPVNVEEQWLEFRRRRYARQPDFRYRPLPFDPGRMKHRLWAVRPERVEDPTLMYLFRDVQRQSDRELSLLSEVGRPEFLHTSLQLHGGVEAGLLALARQILEGRGRGRSRERDELTADQFADLVRAELAEYRREAPGFGHSPKVRDDLYAGLLVSHGHLLIGSRASVPVERADALIQHELGTHVVTWHNGRHQPLRLLSVGLPGYDEIQEGLGVFAEYLADGLDRDRVRTLAARVVAVHALTEGADFIETFRLLCDAGFSRHGAYTITTRVYRGGGLAKDAMYLRGLAAVVDYVAEGLPIENLFIGKYAGKHVSVVEELLFRKVLLQPQVVPRYLHRADARARLDEVRSGLSILDLVKDSARR